MIEAIGDRHRYRQTPSNAANDWLLGLYIQLRLAGMPQAEADAQVDQMLAMMNVADADASVAEHYEIVDVWLGSLLPQQEPQAEDIDPRSCLEGGPHHYVDITVNESSVPIATVCRDCSEPISEDEYE